MDVFASDAALRHEADHILHERGLLVLLERFGAPRVHGSYSLQLMTWRDLDVYLVADHLSVATFFALGGDIATQLAPVRMSFRNERRAQTPTLPIGLYWGVYLEPSVRDGWKIDPWAITTQEDDAFHRQEAALAQRLTSDSRRTILELKAHYWRDPRYKATVTSQDLYRAVLEYGVTTVSGVERYLQERDDAEYGGSASA